MSEDKPVTANEVVPGSFLVASPSLGDPNFRRTVVLVCEHGEQGTVGLIVNRPTPHHLWEVIENMEALPGTTDDLMSSPGTIFSGGPVEMNRLMVVRDGRPPAGDEDLQEVWQDVYLVADITQTIEKVRLDKDLDPYRFYLGYSGWGEGQLEDELHQGAWIVLPPQDGFVFTKTPLTVWRNALRKLGGEFSLYAEMPHDPELN